MDKKIWILTGIVVLFAFLITINIINIKKEYFTNINYEEEDKEKNNKITKYKIGPSQIHGNGVLCTQGIDEGELIDVAIIRNVNENDITITPNFGIYINHHRKSNTHLVKEENNNNEIYYIIASRQINPGEEITKDYDADDIPNFIKGSEESWN